MNELKEFGKEILRVVLIAVVPVLITSLESGSVDLRLIGVIAAVAALRALEKVLHKRDSKLQLPI